VRLIQIVTRLDRFSGRSSLAVNPSSLGSMSPTPSGIRFCQLVRVPPRLACPRVVIAGDRRQRPAL